MNEKWKYVSCTFPEQGYTIQYETNYIYQDLKIALIGYFKKGIMVRLLKSNMFFYYL